MLEIIFSLSQYADHVVIWLLMILSVVSVAVACERYFALARVYRSSYRIRQKIRQAFNQKDLNIIDDIIEEDSLEARALQYGVEHIKNKGRLGLEEAFNSFTLAEKPELEKSVGILATIGSNSPYIGLLGTVFGIMKAFNDLASASAADQTTVMAGISVALVATATGLFVAIPSVAAFNFLQSKISAILENIENVKELCLATQGNEEK